MTQPNKQEPVLRYSEENDPLVTPQEYRLRVGKALRTLNDELPQFFDRGLCTTSIYASNIRLIEASHTNASMQGKTFYFLLAGAVRWSFKVWFRDLEFEIQSIRVNDRGQRGLKGTNSGSDFDNTTASSRRLFSVSDLNNITETHQRFANGFSSESAYHRHPQKSRVVVGTNHLDKFGEMIDSAGSRKGISDGERLPLPATTITVRWTMKGTTRPSVVLTSSGPTLPPPSYYSGVFIYKFNDLGHIDEHRIENIMPSPSPEAIQRAISWWGWLLSRTRPAAAAATDSSETGTRKRLGLGCITNK
ncbi:hypothetical protein BGX21_008717 [Mortierella sp. AD011]|nr:hypothetical protein BGX20_003685 [Mortierella sp. AD010]KAF9397585.1 hypothetical protein BGX21_008717 [Mortierella sp. AD011]